MVVTIQTYSVVSPSWASADIANVWRQILIDAGLMSDWFDSVTSGSYEHRILRLTNDASKTYGYQYIWFIFTFTNISIQFATGWNASTHTPVGTQYADYYSSSCGASSTGSNTLLSLDNAKTYHFVRYTSGNSTIITCAGKVVAAIRSSVGVIPSWLDLNKTPVFTFFGFTATDAGYSKGWRGMSISLPYQLRRMLYGNRSYGGSYYNTSLVTNSYSYQGETSNLDANDPSNTSMSYVRLPVFSPVTNPAYSTNYAPIVTGIDLLPTLDCKLSSDFGFVTTLGFVPSARDTIVVTEGVEEWEVVMSASCQWTDGMSLVARTV